MPEPGSVASAGDIGAVASVGDTRGGGPDHTRATADPFEGERKSPETIAALTFLRRQLLTGTLGTMLGTILTRQTLG